MRLQNALRFCPVGQGRQPERTPRGETCRKTKSNIETSVWRGVNRGKRRLSEEERNLLLFLWGIYFVVGGKSLTWVRRRGEGLFSKMGEGDRGRITFALREVYSRLPRKPRGAKEKGERTLVLRKGGKMASVGKIGRRYFFSL